MIFRWDIGPSPWNVLLFVGVGLTAFTDYRWLTRGGHMLAMEAVILVFVILPFVFIQLKMGGLLQKSLYGLFAESFPFFRGIAVMIMVQLLLLEVYMPILPATNLAASFAYVTKDRSEITSCTNAWNTPDCYTHSQSYDYDYNDYGNVTTYHSFDKTDPVDEFIDNWFLAKSEGLTGFGEFRSPPIIPFTLLVTWVFIFLMVGFGPRNFGWIVSILGLVSTVMMIGVMGYGLGKLRSKDAFHVLLYYYVPNWIYVIDPFAWAHCINRLVYTTGVFIGILPTMGKFMGPGKVKRNISWLFVFLQLSFLRHLPIFTFSPYLKLAAESRGISVGEEFTSFLNLNNIMRVFSHSGTHPAALFFFLIADFIRVTCSVGLYLVVILDNFFDAFDWIISKSQLNRRYIWLIVSAVLCLILFLAGIPFSSQGGSNLLLLVDVAVGNFSFLIWYFVMVGLLGVYLWQNVAMAERIVFGIWILKAATLSVAFTLLMYVRNLHDNWVFQGERNKWWAPYNIIGAIPLVFVFLGIVVFVIQFLVSGRKSSGQTLEQPPVYHEAVSLVNREPTEENTKENVELVTKFES